HQTHSFANGAQLLRQQDLDGQVFQKTIGLACGCYCVSGADRQCLLQSCRNLIVAEAARADGGLRLLPDIIHLRLSPTAAHAESDGQRQRDDGFFHCWPPCILEDAFSIYRGWRKTIESSCGDCALTEH